MNKRCFRLIFSKSLGFLIPVAEITRAQRKAGQLQSAAPAAPSLPNPTWSLKRLALSLLLVGIPGWAAADILVDPNRPTGTNVISAANGVPVIEIANAPPPFDMEKAQAHVATKMTFDWVTARAFNQVFRPFDKPAFAAALAYSNMPFILRSSRSFAVNAEKHGSKYRTVRQWMTLRGMWKKGPYSELNLQRSARDLTVRPSPLQPSTPPFPMRPATDGHTSPPHADGFIDVAHPPLISLDTGDDVSAEQSPPPLRIDLSGDESDSSSLRF